MITRERPLLLAGSYAALYGVMVCLTSFFPWCADDFCHWGGPKFSLPAILHAEWMHYLHANGRSVAHLIVRILLLSNQWGHRLLTPLVFVGILHIAQVLLWGRAWRERTLWWHPVLLFMLFWLYIPAFGEAILWRTGAGNYCWTSFFALLFLVPFRFLLDDPSLRPTRVQTFLLMLLGVCAGWSNENVGIVIFLASAASVAYARWKSGRWPLWAVLCCAMSLVGWLFLILAPGNYVRLQHPAFKSYRDLSIKEKLIGYSRYWYDTQHRFLPLYIIMFLGMISWKRRNKNFPFSALTLFIMAQLMLGAFVLSVIPPLRALTMISILFCISTAFFLYERSVSACLRKMGIIVISVSAIISVLAFMPHFYHQLSIMYERDRLVASSPNPTIPSYRRTNSRYFYPETLTDFDTDWEKGGVIKYFNLKDINIDKQGISEEIVYDIDGVKFIFQKNKNNNYTINCSVEYPQKNKKYKVHYIPYATKKLIRFYFAPLYEALNINLHEKYNFFYKIYQATVISPEGVDITTFNNNFSDIKYISYEDENTKERVFVRVALPPEKE